MMKKIKPVSKIRTMIDSLAEINAEYKRLGDAKKDLETLLKKYFEEKELTPEEDYIFVGELFQCDLGQVGMKRTIKDIRQIREFLGDDPFMNLATVKLSDIDKYLSTAQKAQTLDSKREGSRVMKFSDLPQALLPKGKSKPKKAEEKKITEDYEF